MIPYLNPNIPGDTLPPLQDAYNDEVFIGQVDMADSLHQRQVSPTETTELWDALMSNAGVHFGENRKVETMTSGKLYCIRTLGPLPLVSVNGLVMGLNNKELSRDSRDFSIKRLAQIAYIGYQFTPDREVDISEALAGIVTNHPEMQRYIDKLIA